MHSLRRHRLYSIRSINCKSQDTTMQFTTAIRNLVKTSKEHKRTANCIYPLVFEAKKQYTCTIKLLGLPYRIIKAVNYIPLAMISQTYLTILPDSLFDKTSTFSGSLLLLFQEHVHREDIELVTPQDTQSIHSN